MADSLVFAVCSNSTFFGDTAVGPLSPRVCLGAGLIDTWSQISWSKPSEDLKCAQEAAVFFNFRLKKILSFHVSMIELLKKNNLHLSPTKLSFWKKTSEQGSDILGLQLSSLGGPLLCGFFIWCSKVTNTKSSLPPPPYHCALSAVI